MGEPSDTLTPTKKTVYNYKWHWRNFIRKMETMSSNFFAVWTNAPLVEAATDDNAALLSHQFCTWAKDTLAAGLDIQYGEFPENVYIFDFFHKLAGPDYKLRSDYAAGTNDSHPNAAATELVAPQFVTEIFDAAIEYEQNFLNEAVPELISPLDNSEGIRPDVTFRWKEFDFAENYLLQVATDADFNNIVFEKLTDSTAVKAQGLGYNRSYVWRVKAVFGILTSEFCKAWTFRTADFPPDQPELLYPENRAINIETKPVFRWKSQRKIDKYHIYVAEDIYFDNIIYSRIGIRDTFIVPQEELLKYRKYYWYISAYNDDGLSVDSEIFEFTTGDPLPNKVKLINPPDESTDISPFVKFEWYEAGYAEQYRINIFKDDMVLFISDTTDVSNYSTDYLETNSVYYWGVAAINSTGLGEESEIWKFTTGTAVDLIPSFDCISADDDCVELNHEFKWTKISDAKEYEIEIYFMDNYSNPMINEIVEDNSWIVYPIMKSGRDYSVRIRTIFESRTGPWSDFLNFKTVTIPDRPVITYPLNNYNGVSPDPVFKWTESTCAKEYYLEIAKDIDFADYLSISSESNTVTPENPLDDETEYFLRVKAQNSAGQSSWSEIVKFRTGTNSVFNSDINWDYIYPNPFDEIILLKVPVSNNPVRIDVVDINGVSIYCKEHISKEGKLAINTAGLNISSGLYYIRIINGDNIQILKAIKL